jgi:hypothetical protein
MRIIEAREFEHLVRETFPAKRRYSAESELGLNRNPSPLVTFVHGGPDPFLDRQFDAWLDGSSMAISLYQILNRLCRAGALAPGDYAVMRRA